MPGWASQAAGGWGEGGLSHLLPLLCGQVSLQVRPRPALPPAAGSPHLQEQAGRSGGWGLGMVMTV